MALARATGQGRFLIPTLAHLGATQAALGQLAMARRSSEDAVDTARLTGPASLRLWALIYAVQVELHAGDLHAAHALARDAHRLADQLPPSSFTAKAHALLATTTLELGDPDVPSPCSTAAAPATSGSTRRRCAASSGNRSSAPS